MQPALLVVAAAIFAIIAYSDMRERRIPNALSLAIGILGITRIFLADDSDAAGQTLAAGSVIFAATFFLFWRGVLGGGDAKLVAAAVLLIGYQKLFIFLFLMSLCGGALALTILARDSLRVRHWRRSRRNSTAAVRESVEWSGKPVDSTVPYGVAVAAAGVITLILETPLAG
jgi:prepilin peptidase CpaA